MFRFRFRKEQSWGLLAMDGLATLPIMVISILYAVREILDGHVHVDPRFRRLPARRPVMLDSRRARRVRGRGHRGRDCGHRMVRGKEKC